MRNRLPDVQSPHFSEADRGNRVADRAIDHFLEHVTDVGWFTLLEWAKREAPDLLRMLLASYLTGGFSPERGASGSAGATLEDSEREHVHRVVSESRTLTEAAAKLGIHSTTLWRKLKRYKGGTL